MMKRTLFFILTGLLMLSCIETVLIDYTFKAEIAIEEKPLYFVDEPVSISVIASQIKCECSEIEYSYNINNSAEERFLTIEGEPIASSGVISVDGATAYMPLQYIPSKEGQTIINFEYTIEKHSVSISDTIEIVSVPEVELNLIAFEGGEVSPKGETVYQWGESATITATADRFYSFDKWSDGNTLNPREILLQKDCTLFASFVKSTDLTFDATVTIDQKTANNHEKRIIEVVISNYIGEEITLDYRINKFRDEPIYYQEQAITKPTTINISNSKTILLEYTPSVYGHKEIDILLSTEEMEKRITIECDILPLRYTLILENHDESGGSITPNGVTTHNEGAQVKITASPNSGYTFEGWYDVTNNESVSNREEIIVMNSDRHFTASWSRPLPDNFSLSVRSEKEVSVGTVLLLGVLIENQMKYSEVRINCNVNSSKEEMIYYKGEPMIESIVLPCKETEEFEFTYTPASPGQKKIKFMVSTPTCYQEYEVDVTALPTTYTLSLTAGSGGSVEPQGHTDYLSGTAVDIIATPNEGYIFDRWSDSNTDNPRTLVIEEDISLTAIFKEKPKSVSCEILPTSSAGSVTGTGSYQKGSIATLIATPTQGYNFEKWGDNNTDNPRTLVIEEDISLQAIFSLHQILVEPTIKPSSAAGTIQGQGTYEYGETVTLTASPSDGYRFSKWIVDEQEYDSQSISISALGQQIECVFDNEIIHIQLSITSLTNKYNGYWKGETLSLSSSYLPLWVDQNRDLKFVVPEGVNIEKVSESSYNLTTSQYGNIDIIASTTDNSLSQTLNDFNVQVYDEYSCTPIIEISNYAGDKDYDYTTILYFEFKDRNGNHIQPEDDINITTEVIEHTTYQKIMKPYSELIIDHRHGIQVDWNIINVSSPSQYLKIDLQPTKIEYK